MYIALLNLQNLSIKIKGTITLVSLLVLSKVDCNGFVEFTVTGYKYSRDTMTDSDKRNWQEI